MKISLALLIIVLPASAQFLTAPWRGEELTDYAEWNIFTSAKFTPNSPDIAGDHAAITCTTSSAFLTSSGNIYSFQAPTYFQLDASTGTSVKNLFLQIEALGSGIDLETARLIALGNDGGPAVYFPTQTMILSEEELGGERGGVGTVFALQWNLAATPITGNYTILFNATGSSLSLSGVSLDSSSKYLPVLRPRPLKIEARSGEVHLTWSGGGTLQSSSLLSAGWVDVPEAVGKNSITLPMTQGPVFFRIQQGSVTE